MYEYGNIFWSPTIHVDGNEVIITLSKSRDKREREVVFIKIFCKIIAQYKLNFAATK